MSRFGIHRAYVPVDAKPAAKCDPSKHHNGHPTGTCPLHNPTGYADCQARHARAYNGAYSGYGSTI